MTEVSKDDGTSSVEVVTIITKGDPDDLILLDKDGRSMNFEKTDLARSDNGSGGETCERCKATKGAMVQLTGKYGTHTVCTHCVPGTIKLGETEVDPFDSHITFTRDRYLNRIKRGYMPTDFRLSQRSILREAGEGRWEFLGTKTELKDWEEYPILPFPGFDINRAHLRNTLTIFHDAGTCSYCGKPGQDCATICNMVPDDKQVICKFCWEHGMIQALVNVEGAEW